MKDQLCDHCSGYGLHREHCIVLVAHSVLYENPDLVELYWAGKAATGVLMGKMLQKRPNCSPVKARDALLALLNKE